MINAYIYIEISKSSRNLVLQREKIKNSANHDYLTIIHFKRIMSNTIEYSLLRDQTLIDVVDEDWEAEELPTAVSYTHLTLPTNREV